MPKTQKQKREEAEARAEAYAKRTPEEQLALISTRPGLSEREDVKLQRRITKKEA